jgi:hypothetical protein
MMWIRMSTRQLCLEVNKNQDEDTLALQLPTYIVDTASFGVQLTPDPNLDEKLLARMDLDDIHHILCSFYQWHYVTTSAPGMVLLGAVAWPTSNCPHRFNPFSEFPFPRPLDLQDTYASSWEYVDAYTAAPAEVLFEGEYVTHSGWTRWALPRF